MDGLESRRGRYLNAIDLACGENSNDRLRRTLLEQQESNPGLFS